MRWPLAALLAAAAALAPATAFAHDPPPGENSLVERAVHQIFDLVPGWLLVLALALVAALLLGLYLAWRRWRFVVFVDRPE